jgi:hypothetical protein
MKEIPMIRIAMLAVALAAVGMPPVVSAQAPAPAKKSAAKDTSAQKQKTFASPEEAAKALADAVRAADVAALLAVVGPESKSWIFTGDKVQDRADWKTFLAAYDKKNAIAREGDSKAILELGEGNWPFPAPLVKKGGQWAFDAAAGREEVTNRRVGTNELGAIQTLLAVVDAQREYASSDPDKNGIANYAAKFISTPGKKDGLYWEAKGTESESPLGPLVGAASAQGYGAHKSSSKPRPYYGYYYRIISTQGKDAQGGALDYRVKGHLFGGFAVVAYPSSYGVSGVKTFIVNHAGTVYEKDLGASTASVAAAMNSYNPDKTWKKAE